MAKVAVADYATDSLDIDNKNTWIIVPAPQYYHWHSDRGASG